MSEDRRRGETTLRWAGTVSSEGPGFVVADVSTYARWRGNLGSDKPGFRFDAWGGLASLLDDAIPKQRAYASRAEALAEMSRFFAVVEERFANTRVLVGRQTLTMEETRNWARTGSGELTLVAEGNRLRISFGPMTDYDCACFAADRDSLRGLYEVNLGGAPLAYWRIVGGCVAEVALSRGPDVDEVVLVTHPHRDHAKERSALLEALGERSRTENEGGVLPVPEGTLVIADIVCASTDLVLKGGEDRVLEILRAASWLEGPIELNAKGMLGVATVLRVKAGTYRLFDGEADGAGWCRLRRESR